MSRKLSNLEDVSLNKYDKHVFVCVNSRIDLDRTSCGDYGLRLRDAIIEGLREHSCNLDIRINKSGCLNECKLGPAIVIYPQGFWYYNVELSDVPEIIEKSIIGDDYIKRLKR